MHDEIMALVRKQFTAAEIAIKLGCVRADVYAAINGPEIEFVDAAPINMPKRFYRAEGNGDWTFFERAKGHGQSFNAMCAKRQQGRAA